MSFYKNYLPSGLLSKDKEQIVSSNAAPRGPGLPEPTPGSRLRPSCTPRPAASDLVWKHQTRATAAAGVSTTMCQEASPGYAIYTQRPSAMKAVAFQGRKQSSPGCRHGPHSLGQRVQTSAWSARLQSPGYGLRTSQYKNLFLTSYCSRALP